MSVEIRTFVIGPFMVNTLLVSQGGQCWIVDPGEGCSEVVDQVRADRLEPKAILLTHGHVDHIAGVPELTSAFEGIALICSADDAPMLADPQLNLSALMGQAITMGPADRVVSPGDELELGATTWQVLDTGGHGPGGVSYYCADAGVAIVGDSVFASSIGRTDWPGSDERRLLRNIRRNILSLPPGTRLITGHGPDTTVEIEKAANPFLQIPGG